MTMANLPEESKFDDGVYQLELTDPVIGGPNGISNRPIRNLANRTQWLKAQISSILAKKADLNGPTFNGGITVNGGASFMGSESVTGPRPADADDSFKFATTSWVRRVAAPLNHVGAGGSVHPEASTTQAGFMSAADKQKLNSIAAGAQSNAVTSVAGRSGAVTLSVSDISGAMPSSGGTFSGRVYAALADYADPNDASVLTFAWLKKYGVLSVAGRKGNVTLSVGDVSGAAPSSSPTFSGRISVAAGTITDLNHESGAKVYVPAKRAGDMSAPEAVSKYALTDYAAPKYSPSITGGMSVRGGASFLGSDSVTAPRPADSDDSFKVATTGWVRRAMEHIFSAAGFRIEQRAGVTPGSIERSRAIQSSEGDCGMITLPSFMGGLKFAWVNCNVVKNTQWREVMWISPFDHVFTGGGAAFAVNDAAVSVHPFDRACRISVFDRSNEYINARVYVWAIGK